jgi:ATP-binding cassette subfamily B protein
MKLLLNYLKHYKWLVILALVLATINQIFSLLDPWIFKKIVDNYAMKANTYTKTDFIKGVGLLILASMGVAMVSRIAKNFQDYYVNVVTQKLGAQIYSDGLKHSLE